MPKKTFAPISLTLDVIVGGGQALGTAPDGIKVFAWNGLPGEQVTVQPNKKKSRMVESVVTDVISPSADRITPRDPASYLSTSPWQMMSFDAEQRYKAALIEEAFELHDIVLPDVIDVYTDGREFEYRNKVEFSWFGNDTDAGETLDLAFFRRGSKGKIIVDQCSLLPPSMMQLALAIRDMLSNLGISARQLKTVMIRCNQSGDCVWQLYVKDETFPEIDLALLETLPARGGEIIYSDPRSPASRITKRLQRYGDIVLTDTVLDVPFRYATEGFFQINIPVYEQALRDMRQWVEPGKSVVDLYSGVGSIGLTIGGTDVTLIEINEDAVREMRENIVALGREDTARAVLAPSEKALDYITSDACVIVDPPRAGLHADVVAKLLDAAPARIIYLSCNPVTQARDVELLAAKYGIRAHRGYNFFPRTPHIEHLVVLDLK